MFFMRYLLQRLSRNKKLLGLTAPLAVSVGIAALGSVPAYAESTLATDQMLARVLTVHLPTPIYKSPSVPTSFGHYNLKVELSGAAKVSSYPKDVKVSLPLNVSMAAVLSALPMKQSDGKPLSCNTEFQTTAQFTVSPTFQKDKVKTSTQLNLPVPQTVANCGVMQIPLQPMLQAIVDANQEQWESQFNDVIEQQLNPIAKAQPSHL